MQGPDPETVQRLFPLAAVQAGYKTGLGVVSCTVAHTGMLTDCAVVREDPAGMEFGQAALAVAKVMQMNPWTTQGVPVDGAKVEVPIRLNLDATGPSTSAPAGKGGN
jgi:hypothetical protein